MTDAHDAKVTSSKDKITARGKLNNGLQYETQVLVLNQGGSIKAENGTISFSNSTSAKSPGSCTSEQLQTQNCMLQ